MTSITGISNTSSYISVFTQCDLRGTPLKVGDYVSFMVVLDPSWVYGQVTGLYNKFAAVQVLGTNANISVEPKTLLKVTNDPKLTAYLLKS